MVRERINDDNWAGKIDYDSNWFGNQYYGLRYHMIELPLFRNKLSMKIEGAFGFYLEIPYTNKEMTESIEDELIDLFVEEFYRINICVHKKEWRYLIIDDIINDTRYRGVLITFDSIKNSCPNGRSTVIDLTGKRIWFGDDKEGHRYILW